LAGHELAVREVGGLLRERRRARAVAAPGLAVTRDAVLREQRAAALGRRRHGRHDLDAHAGRLREPGDEPLDVRADAIAWRILLDAAGDRVEPAPGLGGQAALEVLDLLARLGDQQLRLLDLEGADDLPRVVERLAVLLAHR